ncbi:MAG: hypothetical protein ABI947_14885 [Chloroflexota bacterium]
MSQAIQDWVAYTDQHRSTTVDQTDHESMNTVYGRIEIRRCWAIADCVFNRPMATDTGQHTGSIVG